MAGSTTLCFYVIKFTSNIKIQASFLLFRVLKVFRINGFVNLLLVQVVLMVIIKASVKLILKVWGFPGGAVVGNLPASAGDTGSSPGLRGSHMPRSN